ncbi:hypothetical protein R5R35_012596 [Gryllus longicercus]|uniref:Protein SET n=1 Tax=Gryllus longicercus TaxID=2509291 RepID=A0AAN9Z283_9ORTH
MSINGVTSKKIKKLEQNETDDERDYDAQTQKAMSEIDACQETIDELNGQASEEILKVVQKYNRLRKPHYDKRQEIISRIPNFWVTALLNHPHIIPILHAEEEDCLYYLFKIEVEESEDIKSGYKIKFYFKENPYFENELLVKEHHLGPFGKITSTGTTIKWKDGQDLEEKIGKKSEKSKSRKRSMDSKSFFGWLTDHSNPDADDIAEVIKDEIWSNPLQYFLMSDTLDDDDDDDDNDEEEENVDHGENDTEEEDECEDEDLGEDGEGLVEEETEAEEEIGEYGCGNGSIEN